MNEANFDRVVKYYRGLETIAFGNALQNCRTHWLGKLEVPKNALIVGEGNGRFLCELLRAHPQIQVDCVDASAQMLALARQRLARLLPESLSRVGFFQQDVRSWTPSHAYDLIVTHFFLDCFSGEEIAAIVQRLACASTNEAVWLIADFSIPASGIASIHAQLWLKTMYLFFRTTTGLDAKKLVDPTPYLQANGFVRSASHVTRSGMLKSEMWRKNRNQ